MNKIFLFLVMLIPFISSAKEIALTFDDAPRFATGYFDGPTRSKKLIQKLRQAQVDQVAFFAVAKNLNSEGLERLKRYASAGHLIGNHTTTHPDYNQTEMQDYIRDFERADQVLSSLPGFIKWFRFPFLREGDTSEKRDKMRRVLDQHHYRNAYITVDNYDWYMEEQFQREVKKNPSLDLKKFGRFYVGTLISAVNYYDEMAVRNLGRSPKHVILLHETDVNALFIGDLIEALRQQGWTLISPQMAMEDGISKMITTRLFKNNPGRIAEIAADHGQSRGLWHESCDEEFLENELNKQVLQ